MKTIAGFVSFIANRPVEWGAPRQASVQPATYGAELNSLKISVERAFMMRYHLWSMGVLASNPTTTCCDNKAVVTITTTAGRIINKKYLALTYYFYREHFSTEVIDIRWVEGNNNIADFMKKCLGTTDFYSHNNIEISTNQMVMWRLCCTFNP